MDYKRLLYGVADYTWIKSQNRYCADKTMFIPKMEKAGDFLYLLQILLFINAAHRRNIKKLLKFVSNNFRSLIIMY